MHAVGDNVGVSADMVGLIFSYYEEMTDQGSVHYVSMASPLPGHKQPYASLLATA